MCWWRVGVWLVVCWGFCLGWVLVVCLLVFGLFVCVVIVVWFWFGWVCFWCVVFISLSMGCFVLSFVVFCLFGWCSCLGWWCLVVFWWWCGCVRCGKCDGCVGLVILCCVGSWDLVVEVYWLLWCLFVVGKGVVSFGRKWKVVS